MSPVGKARDPETERVLFRKEMARVQESLRTVAGLAFSHEELLSRAFHHRSFVRENEGASSYERLEFLGDRVLELCVAEWLYTRFPKAEEGFLSKELAWRVDEANLARVEDQLQLKKAMRIGTSIGKEGISDKMVSDVVEAIIGGIFLDVGMEAARRFVLAFVPMEGEPPKGFHSTNELLESCLAKGLGQPQFVESEGQGNDAVWTVECVVAGERTIGCAKRKRDARKLACQKMLRRLTEGKDAL